MSRLSIKTGFRTLALVCFAIAIAFQAQASPIEISPVKVDLSAKVRVSALTVHNLGEDETVMQVSLMHWPSAEDLVAIEPGIGLLVTPTTFRLAGGAQQIVRVGLSGAAPLQTELAYRLIIEEVPPVLEQDTTGMRLVVRHDLPVFVAPAARALRLVNMQIDCSPTGAELRLLNSGNSHLKVLRLALKESSTGATQGDWKAFDYVLPGTEKRWLLSTVAPDAKAKGYTATAYTENETFSAEVQNQCR
jgi:fimbrial chaperone protein